MFRLSNHSVMFVVGYFGSCSLGQTFLVADVISMMIFSEIRNDPSGVNHPVHVTNRKCIHQGHSVEDYSTFST